MAKTSAERQAAYRARRAGQDSSERRINTWVSREAYLTLDALAVRYGVTRRAVIELLVFAESGRPKESIAIPSAVAGRRPPALRGSDSQQVANTNKKPKERRTTELPRNDAKTIASKKGKKQAVHAVETGSSQPLGAQFELAL